MPRLKMSVTVDTGDTPLADIGKQVLKDHIADAVKTGGDAAVGEHVRGVIVGPIVTLAKGQT